ncbi:MAG: hypothetical protein COA62_05965 [Rhodobiaceae bacterium]|nr:MAG: hypothetical protein COA62_05965 [Rhodobiaceae bacterium]
MMSPNDNSAEGDDTVPEENESQTTAPGFEDTSSSDTSNIPENNIPEYVDRWTLLRDVTVFQGKLLLDGLRDLVLSPISIAAAVIALLRGGEQPGRQFYDLLYMGKRSEHWINLFGATKRVSPPSFDQEGSESVDALVERLETVARRQYEKGGLTQNAKHAVDRALDAIDRGLNHRK